MPEEIEQLNRRIKILENLIFSFIRTDRYVFEKDLQLSDGKNIQTGKGTGTKIAIASDQKLGFFGAPPIVQGANITPAPTPGANYVQAEMIAISTRLNTLILRQEGLGFNAS